ncbi:MAG: hypothetical protein GYA71_09515 [Bacteroidales bacterium]|nr:hypothetical protein [Bacteroidales bacterium]
MKSTGNYFYVKKTELKSDFTQIPNALFYINLSATEKLILAYLLSNAESFRITIYRIAKSVGSDHRTIKKALEKFRAMKLIRQVTDKTIAVNIIEILRLAAVPEDKEYNNGNLPKSTIFNDDSINGSSPISIVTDIGTPTHSNTPTNVVGQLPLNSGNTTTNIPGELPDNNINQQEIKEEKQKEVSPSFSAIELAKESDDYLKTPSKFFYGHNQLLVTKLYERYRVEISDKKITSIKIFQSVLYYYLLKITNSSTVQDLNQLLSKSKLTLSLNEISKTVQLVSTKKDVNADYKKEVNAVYDNPSKVSNPD